MRPLLVIWSRMLINFHAWKLWSFASIRDQVQDFPVLLGEEAGGGFEGCFGVYRRQDAFQL
ncbi:MAG: hypothetical protein RBG13Loki_3919 [Promethearchaeota archaeon CR_4]|nr:MAG: hypothetical protein RBG13Loki_3919 [Candidatus Lokiarchaeota archaeon CR_4]